jgi:hypothetical protein
MRFLSVLSELCGECFKFLFLIGLAIFQASGRACESEGGQGFGAIPLKIPRSLLRGASSLRQHKLLGSGTIIDIGIILIV